jgi:hypothetical protein
MKKSKATKLVVGLPFNLGKLEFEPDEVQQQAAWELYVELNTRIATQPLPLEQGGLRDALSSLHNIFEVTREILREAGPSVAQGPNSLGALAIEVLNKGLRPFLTKWHPKLQEYEQKNKGEIPTIEFEQNWEYATELREELSNLQEQMSIYTEALAAVAGISRVQKR